MRRSAFPSFLASIGAFLALATTVEGTPFLPADIRVGAGVTGSFSFPVSNSPPDSDPSAIVGRYVPDSSAQMVANVGGFVFSSKPGGLLVQVIDQSVDADWIQLFGTGDELTFSPFLTGFLRQDPLTDPYGQIGLNFRFSPTHFTDDAFPISIDPLATVPHPFGPRSGISGSVAGVSTTSIVGQTEWAFFFDVDPLTMSFMMDAGVLSGTFSGTIFQVDDQALVTVPAPIPEPSSFILLLSGLLAFRKSVRANYRRRSTTTGSLSMSSPCVIECGSGEH